MAIEANQLTERDTLIEKFYTVRAGLSVIAEENEKIREAKEDITEAKKSNDSYNQTTKSNFDYEMQKFNNTKSSIEKDLYEKRNVKLSYEGQLKAATKKKTETEKVSAYKYRKEIEEKASLWGGLIGFYLPGLCMFGGLFLAPAIGVTAYISLLIAYWPVAIFCVLRYGFSTGGKEKKRIISIHEKEIAQCKTSLAKVEKEIEELENKLSVHLKTKPNEEKCVFDKYLPSIKQLESKYYNKVVPQSTERAKAIRNSLLEVTNGIIVEEDWANVDLLIFYLKTGRANSLQDALLLVDKQLQTEQITNAISKASEYVSNTIQENTTKMAQFLAASLSSLSNQIQRNHRELIGELNYTRQSIKGAISDMSNNVGSLGRQINSSMSELNSNIREQNEALVSTREINRALLNNSQRSSEELMHELRYNQNLWVK